MARDYAVNDFKIALDGRRYNICIAGGAVCIASLIICASGFSFALTPGGFTILAGIIPGIALFFISMTIGHSRWIEKERKAESARRGGKPVLGNPPNRHAFDQALKECRDRNQPIIDKYLVGFEIDSGEPIWVADDEITSHGAVFAKTGVGKTLWLEGLMFQQMARGRASGFTFIDAKRDPGTLADIILMAMITGRVEDVIVIDPFDPVCSYNFVFTTQRADVKARKVLRCGLPPTSDASTTKHYDRLAADAVYRVVRTMESLGLAWSVADIAVALSAFTVAYPRMRDLLHEQGAKQAMVELGHLAGSYRTAKGSLDAARLTDNLRGIASELHSIANSEAGEMFCVPRADLSLTDAILRGKLIYYMLPRLEEAESAARMVKVFREDLEVSIGEITSSRVHHLEDPHLVIIDEGASTFGPTWANLFELARKGRFSLLFGAQSISGLMDAQMGLSQEFYDRVIANINLKVIMRLGDNRTADDMSEWIGKINTTKKTISTGLSTSLNARELTKHIEFNRRTADGIRDGFTVSEDETDLVSPEELKHEMSAEKGMAWFDKGDGRLRKGRALWFNAELPPTWEGREYLTRYEAVEADEIGLAEWVDEHILSVERAETKRSLEQSARTGGEAPKEPQGPEGGSKDAKEKDTGDDSGDDGNGFRLNIMKGFRGMGRSRTTIADTPPPPPPKAEAREATATKDAPPKSEPKSETKSDTRSAPPADTKKAEESKTAEAGAKPNTGRSSGGAPGPKPGQPKPPSFAAPAPDSTAEGKAKAEPQNKEKAAEPKKSKPTLAPRRSGLSFASDKAEASDAPKSEAKAGEKKAAPEAKNGKSPEGDGKQEASGKEASSNAKPKKRRRRRKKGGGLNLKDSPASGGDKKD